MYFFYALLLKLPDDLPSFIIAVQWDPVTIHQCRSSSESLSTGNVPCVGATYLVESQ